MAIKSIETPPFHSLGKTLNNLTFPSYMSCPPELEGLSSGYGGGCDVIDVEVVKGL